MALKIKETKTRKTVSVVGLSWDFCFTTLRYLLTVILPDWTLEKWALSSFTFQSFYGLSGTQNKKNFWIPERDSWGLHHASITGWANNASLAWAAWAAWAGFYILIIETWKLKKPSWLPPLQSRRNKGAERAIAPYILAGLKVSKYRKQNTKFSHTPKHQQNSVHFFP